MITGRPARNEFHISRSAREFYGLQGVPFSSTGNVVLADYAAARLFAARINARSGDQARVVTAGSINAMALIDEILHVVCALYREHIDPAAFRKALQSAEEVVGRPDTRIGLTAFTRTFPPATVQAGHETADSWLQGLSDGIGKGDISLEELLLLRLANENPAFAPFRFLFDDRPLKAEAPVDPILDATETALKSLPLFGPDGADLLTLLRAPMRASPHSLAGQLDYIKRNWGMIIGDRMARILGGVDMLDEEERPRFPAGPGPARVLSYEGLDVEYERFSEDKDWMPRVVMIAKSALVWLDQLSRSYGRDIGTLDAIPDDELDTLASRGFNALWLIGIWERSRASRRIKELCGNPEAAASAYSLFDYEIAGELGGWPALETLRNKAESRGIRLAADMVPNHTGLDSAWVRDRPDLFISRHDPPFRSYSFGGENLSEDGRFGLWLEDHYYSRSDAAVVFKRVDFRSGDTRYIYHGNDGTSMPWNDTAQIDFMNPAAREAVKERILHVARNFPIIRFDAAMILAKRSFRRLWYPEPGVGGAIASRFESAMPTSRFNELMPAEFWREVVDMCAASAPETLLLAEAFWMMEGYFVRTLGMHRVYNSAFMNMLKEKKNAEYRATIKNTIEFDKDILKRFVNFMNNPDEETAVAQFGTGDHYFGVCSMMATMPGLPMFGHGQVEGFTEKYGMEYRRAYKDERPDENFVRRHEHEIFPLLKRRRLFSGADEFLLFDMVHGDGSVDENVFAYTNGYSGAHAIVLYNNAWERTAGRITRSCPYAEKRPDGSRSLTTRSLSEGLGLRCGHGRFVVLTEMKSGLRYLRRSDDIAAAGLRVTLEGFQCQVFVDIAEFDDDASGSYATLCDALRGSGVPDVRAALQDLSLAELYHAWSAAYGPAWFRKAAAPNSTDKETLLEYMTIITRYIEVAHGTPAAETINAWEPDAVESAIDVCLEAVRNSIALMEAAQSTHRRATRRTALAVLSERVASVPGTAEALAAFVSLLPIASLAGRDPRAAWELARAWGMPRKLAESLVQAGATAQTAHVASELAIAVLGRLDAFVPPFDHRTLARSLAADDEARALLGINRWNDTTWFNAERYKQVSTLAAAAYVALDGSEEAAAAALGALELADAAALASEWNLERFVEPSEDA
jgi:hypothetical protein